MYHTWFHFDILFFSIRVIEIKLLQVIVGSGSKPSWPSAGSKIGSEF